METATYRSITDIKPKAQVSL